MKKILLVLSLLFIITGCGSTKNKMKKAEIEEEYILTETEDKKVNNIINSLELDYGNFNFNKLSNQDKIQLLYMLASNLNVDENGNTLFNSPEKYLNKSNFEIIAKDYFGPDANFKMVDINCLDCGEIYYYYDESSGSYRENTNHLGHGASFPIIQRKSVGVTKSDDVVSVKYKILFSNYFDIGAPQNFFSTLSNAKKNSNAIASFNQYCNGDDTDYECDYDKMFNELKLNTYSYNFKVDGDNFYFIDYTIE